MDWQHLFKEYNEEDDSDYEDNRNHNRVQETYVVPPKNGVKGENSNDSVENRKYSLHLETKTNDYFLSRLELQKLNIRIVSHLKQALEICSAEDIILARDKPKGNDINKQLSYVKEYLVAPLKRVFQFAQTWDNGVWLDEVIKSDRLCRVFFDIEIKLGQFTSIPETDILREHVNGLGVDHTEDDLAMVVEAY